MSKSLSWLLHRCKVIPAPYHLFRIITDILIAELHDYMGERGRSFGMPLAEFTDLAYTGLIGGEDQIIIGRVGPGGGYDEGKFREIVDTRVVAFRWLSGLMLGRA
jgi:hypothetical protein